MQKLIECVPNFSEGRDKTKIQQILNSISSISGVKVLNCESDIDHNRSVVTFAGYYPQIFDAAYKICDIACKIIDLTTHKGCHPRFGSMDIMPFIPIKNIDFEELSGYVRKFGEKVSNDLKIPVYLYGSAALNPKHKNLANIRNGCFENLQEKFKIDPPDFGPLKLRNCGAAAIGVRKFLIAYNINLNSSDLNIAKKIAKKVREKDGGLPAVKALGFMLENEGIAQVSMNLTDFEITGIQKVFETVDEEAKKLGTIAKESELIGLIPKAALTGINVDKLKFKNFSEDKILENRLRQEGF